MYSSKWSVTLTRKEKVAVAAPGDIARLVVSQVPLLSLKIIFGSPVVVLLPEI